MVEGTVVICDTGQAGTIIWKTTDQAQVLLASSEIWTGSLHNLRLPQDAEDLANCPVILVRKDPKPVKEY